MGTLGSQWRVGIGESQWKLEERTLTLIVLTTYLSLVSVFSVSGQPVSDRADHHHGHLHLQGAGGGGTQGREGKTKSTKKKGGGNKRGGRRDSFDSDDEEFSVHAKKGNAKSEKSSNSALIIKK